VVLGAILIAVLWQNPLAAIEPAEPPPDKQPEKGQRGMPSILSPTEGRAEVALVQLKSFVIALDGDRPRIMVIKGEKPKGPQNGRAELKAEWLPIESLGDLKTDHPAETVQPMRMAIVVASFPYRKQIQEFKERLHLKTEQDVLNETLPDAKDPKKMNPSFSFVGPLVQRRLVDVHGKPLGKWTDLDVGDNYKVLLRWNGMRFEPDSPAIEAVSFDGLVMPRLATMRKGQYPDVEARLSDLQKTLKELEKTKPEQPVKPKDPFGKDGIDPFEKPKPADPKAPDPKPAKGGEGNAAKTIPDYCLIRVIDVDIHPGQYYQYRIKVRMANPNFGMKNVAVADEAKRSEPLESEWFEIHPKNDDKPQVVAAPPEYHLYVMDQEEIDRAERKKYTGQNVGVPKNRLIAFQIHKWLERTNTYPRLPIGEWSVAERALAYRGEYIGRKEVVEVPYWRCTQERFVLAVSPTTPKQKGIEVDFGVPATENRPVEDYPILVDFGGGPLTYSRVTGRNEVVRVAEMADVETLIYSPDGKLLSYASWNARSDRERINRLDSWRERIKEVKEGK
jgi:hypothetical protein